MGTLLPTPKTALAPLQHILLIIGGAGGAVLTPFSKVAGWRISRDGIPPLSNMRAPILPGAWLVAPHSARAVGSAICGDDGRHGDCCPPMLPLYPDVSPEIAGIAIGSGRHYVTIATDFVLSLVIVLRRYAE